jgi:3D (Asp-Asp-Asp) domain-containing protein
MSHNKIKVAGQEPDKSGDITVNVANLDDVTITSVAADQVLQYDSGSSSWINADTTALSGGTVLFIGDGTSTAYPTGGSALANNVDLHFYNVVYNGVSATVGSGWIDSITLPAGSYLCSAVAGITFSTSNGVATYRFHDGSNFFGTQGNVKDDADTIGASSAGYITSGSSITISVRLNSAPTDVNTLAAQGNRQGEYGYIEIRKLG